MASAITSVAPNIQSTQTIDTRQLVRALAVVEIRKGFTMFAISTAITIGSYMLASAAGGGLFVISFGGIIFGAYHVVHGLYKLATA